MCIDAVCVVLHYSWVRTGDEVKIMEDGEMVVLDRLKVRAFVTVYVVDAQILCLFY